MITLNRPVIGEAERSAVLKVLESGQLASGPMVEELERRWAEMCGVKYAVAVSSGTAALHLALVAHNIGPGDEVLTTPFSFIATANVILVVGATPVFVDIDPDTYCMDPRLAARAVTKRTKACLPVHLYGRPCEGLEGLSVPVIEDACQAAGAPVGKLGTACYSLYATKNVTAGEGGMVTTNDMEVAVKVERLRNHGRDGAGNFAGLGVNYRMSDLHAAVALAQLDNLKGWTEARRRNAKALRKGLHGLPRVMVPGNAEGHVWHQFTVRSVERDTLAERCRAAGVETGVYYPVPLHLVPHIRGVVGFAYCPEAERAAQQVLSLPVHPQLSEADLGKIIEAVKG